MRLGAFHQQVMGSLALGGARLAGALRAAHRWRALLTAHHVLAAGVRPILVEPVNCTSLGCGGISFPNFEAARKHCFRGLTSAIDAHDRWSIC